MKENRNNQFKGRLVFLFTAFLLSACAAVSSSVSPSFSSSSSAQSVNGLTEADRIMNAYTYVGDDSNGLSYYVDPETSKAAVAVGSCTLTSITIPSTYSGHDVVGVKQDGFAGDIGLTSIAFADPSKITMIGSQAFSNTAITAFTIPDNVTELSPSCFLDCRSLVRVSFASTTNLTKIGEYCFADCINLYYCDLPEGITTIGECAFQGDYRLIRFILPSTITTIGKGAFIDCYRMTLAYIPDKVTAIGAYAFKGCLKSQAYFSRSSAPSGTGFPDNWDYVGIDYKLNPVTNSGGAITSYSSLLKKSYSKSNLGSTSDYIYVKADSSQTGSDFDITIIAYIGSEIATNATGYAKVDVIVPDRLEDPSDSSIKHRIVGIDTVAFKDHTEIGDLSFGTAANPSFITKIGADAFNGCNNLTSLDFSHCHLLTTIGDEAFYRSGVSTANVTATTLFIPASVTSIGKRAFYGFNKVTSLTFEDEASDVAAKDATATAPAYPAYSKRSHLVTIDDSAFSYLGNGGSTAPATATCDLVLPCNYLTNIGTTDSTSIKGVFEQAWCLRSIVFRASPTIDGLTAARVWLATRSFYETRALTGTITISANVSRIGADSFTVTSGGGKLQISQSNDTAQLHQIILSQYVTTIVGAPFSGRWRASLYTDVTSANAKPAGWASSYRSVSLATGSSEYEALPTFYNVGDAVGQCHLIHYSVSGYGTFDFVTAADSTGALTESTATCARYYYDGTASTTRTPKVPETIGGTYNGVSVTYTIKSIGQGAFYYSSATKSANSLTEVTLPSAITSLGPVCFMNCKYMTTVYSYSGATTNAANRLPLSLSTISYSAFANDVLLTAIILPSGINSVVEGVFSGCSALASLTMQNPSGTTVTVGDFYSCVDNVLYIGTAYEELLLGAPGATYNGGSPLVLPTTVTKIDDYAFRNATKLTGIKAPASLVSVGSNAFSDCSAFASFRFAATGTSDLTIAANAFNKQTSLTTFEMTSRLKSIGASAFADDAALKYFPTLPSQTSFTDGALDLSGTAVATMGDSAFSGCKGIKSISLPSTLTALNTNVFSSCTGLTSVSLGTGVTSIGTSSFAGDTALTTLNVPDNVLNISGSAFSGDTALTTFTFGQAAQRSIIGRSGTLAIGASAFSGCTGLTSIVIPDNAKFTFSGTSYPFVGCTQTSFTIYLGCTATVYANSGNYPATWNYKSTSDQGSALPFKLYSESTTTDTTYSYWHYVNGVPTPY